MTLKICQIRFLFDFVLGIFWHQFDISTMCRSRVINDNVLFSSAVPIGSGAFQMPTRPASVASALSTLRGEGPISETAQ